MNTDNQHTGTDELLVKYLADEAGAEEGALVEHWVAASEKNRRYFEHFKLLWDASQALMHQNAVDEDKAWGRFRERVQRKDTASHKRPLHLPFLRAAAVILLVAAAVLEGPRLMKHHDVPAIPRPAGNYPEALLTTATTDKIRKDTLADGSIIILNKHSRVTYAAGFRGPTRDVGLTGEAFFTVRQDPAKPFVIKTGDVVITVLGTAFNVNSGADRIEVAVETGRVSVQAKSNVIMLTTGQKCVAIKGDTRLHAGPVTDSGYRSWLDTLNRPHPNSMKLHPDSEKPHPDSIKPRTDKPAAFQQYPDTLRTMISDPGNWLSLLRQYSSPAENLVLRKAIIGHLRDEMTTQQVAGHERITSFRLDGDELFINEKRQGDSVHQWYKKRFIREPGFFIYFGGARRQGEGIYLQRDSL